MTLAGVILRSTCPDMAASVPAAFSICNTT